MGEPQNLAVVVGVGGGLGGAIARALVAQGVYDRVVGIARRPLADGPENPATTFISADILQERDLASAASIIRQLGSVRRVVVATGVLHGERITPEKTMRSLDAATMLELFAVNAVAPAMIAKHLLPLTPRDRPSVFAALSARVGSISDNHLGGWYGYRASKAALNMLIATLAIEQARTHPLSTCVALHPGTVETRLSAPFAQGAVPGRLTPEASATALVGLMDRLGPQDNGGFFAWDGTTIEW